ncbi:MAG TPA: hypothetical protein VLL08_00775 [Kineosporiaceae bacterium]|nr:hypothetical protein [Kineosporiaceae bacterium]
MSGIEPLTGIGGIMLTHAVGHRPGPIPLGYALAAGAVVLWASFDTLRLRWRRARLDPAVGRPVPQRMQALLDGAIVRWVIRTIGLLATAAVVVLARNEPADPENPAIALVYVVFWVGLPVSALLLGPVWRTLNPLRTAHLILNRLVARDPRHGLLALPERYGYWPAAVGLFAFAWLELVSPDRLNPRWMLAWWVGYAVLMLLGALLFGSPWFDRGDPFEAYSALVALLAPWGRRATDRRIVLRNPLHGLAGLVPAPGLRALVAVLLAATGFDALSGTSWWHALKAESALPVLLGTAGLLAVVLLALGSFWLAGWLTGQLADRPGRQISQQIAHSLVPIAVGYVLAHYLTLLITAGPEAIQHAVTALNPLSGEFGQAATDAASNHAGHHNQVGHTMVMPAEPTGVADPAPGSTPAGWPGPIAASVIEVSAVLGGHLVGIIAAHDRLLHLLPGGRRGVIAQVPLLICMIGYTFAALVLLSAR